MRKPRARRKYSDEFKASVVSLVLDEGRSISQVCKDLDLSHSAVCYWVEKAKHLADGTGRGLATAEREELALLRKEVHELKLEREILKKAAAFFAKTQS